MPPRRRSARSARTLRLWARLVLERFLARWLAYLGHVLRETKKKVGGGGGAALRAQGGAPKTRRGGLRQIKLNFGNARIACRWKWYWMLLRKLYGRRWSQGIRLRTELGKMKAAKFEERALAEKNEDFKKAKAKATRTKTTQRSAKVEQRSRVVPEVVALTSDSESPAETDAGYVPEPRAPGESQVPRTKWPGGRQETRKSSVKKTPGKKKEKESRAPSSPDVEMQASSGEEVKSWRSKREPEYSSERESDDWRTEESLTLEDLEDETDPEYEAKLRSRGRMPPWRGKAGKTPDGRSPGTRSSTARGSRE